MTHAAEPDGPSPVPDPDSPDPDPVLDHARAAHSRRGKVWTAAVVSSWSAIAVIALTVGRPELSAVQHIMQRTTGMSAFPPLVDGIPTVAPSPSPAPPSHGRANSPAVQDGSVTRRGGSTRVPGTRAPGGKGPNGPPTATVSASPAAGYTQPPASYPVPSATTPPATVPTTIPPATPTPTPTPEPTAQPSPTPTPYPTYPTSTPTSPAVASCLSSAAGSTSVSSVLGAVTSCSPYLSSLP
jgi:hypothetical protein